MIILSCQSYKKLCDNLVISTGVTFTDGSLIINLPAGNYSNRCKYCLVVAQTIPETTTITAPVAITIGDDTTTTYPLLNCDCTNVYACSINTRTRYSTCVFTDLLGGAFKLLNKIPCSQCVSRLASLPATTTTTAP